MPNLFQQSRLVSRVLGPALRLWLRSQVTSVQTLQVQIVGRDAELLAGEIPQVAIAAEQVVYQELQLTQVALTGTAIRTNLKQVLRGQPFQLLEPIEVQAAVVLTEADLNTSLQAPLLAPLVTQWLRQIESHADTQTKLSDPRLVLIEDFVQLWLDFVDPHGDQGAIAWQAQLAVKEGRWLVLTQVQQLEGRGANLESMAIGSVVEGAAIDLGEAQVEVLQIQPGQLRCEGKLQVCP